MEEETYVLCSYIFLAICVVLLAIFFFCCLGPLIVWFTGEDQDVPVTLRKSLRKSPFGQRSTPPTDEYGFPSVVRRKKSKLDSEGTKLTKVHPITIILLCLVTFWKHDVMASKLVELFIFSINVH